MEKNKSKFLMFTLLSVAIILSVFSVSAFASPAKVNLGTAGDFAILTKAGISTTGTTSIVGDIGVSPIAYGAITGFNLIPAVPDAFTTFATSTLVTGKIYAADYTEPTPTNLGVAILNMGAAYSDALSRPITDPAETNVGNGAGEIGGLTLAPGVYTFTGDSINVIISTDLTLNGNANDVWIFQIPGTLNIASGADVPSGIKVSLTGGAKASNVFWAVAGATTLGTYSTFNGNILTAEPKTIAIQTGAVLNGRALSQGAVTLQSNTVTKPVTIPRTPINLHVNDYTNTHVTISQTETKVEFSLVNPLGQSYDNVVIPFSISGGKLVTTDNNMPTILNDILSSYNFSSFDGKTGTITFKVSDILNGINFTANIADGQTSPTFSNVNIDGTILIGVNIDGMMDSFIPLNSLLNSSTGHSVSEINANPSILDELVANYNPSSVQMVGDASLVKLGNDITITYNKGFTYAQQNYASTDSYIQSVLGSTALYSGNIQSLIDSGNLPSLINDTASLLPFIPFSYQELVNLGYNVSVNLTLIDNNLQDGTYFPIPVTLTSSYGDVITDDIKLTLLGLQATPYVPSTSNPASNWISQLTNLPFGSNDVSISLLNVSDVPSVVGTNINFLQAMNITVDQTTTTIKGGNISFSVAINTSGISDPAKISLYVWETGSSSWTKLSTSLTGTTADDYLFTATTPHFSTFMIGEDTTPAVTTGTGGNSGSGTGTVRTVGGVASSSGTTGTTGTTNLGSPVTATNNNPSPVTGSVIGNFIKSGAGIITLVFLIVLVTASVGLALRKKK